MYTHVYIYAYNKTYYTRNKDITICSTIYIHVCTHTHTSVTTRTRTHSYTGTHKHTHSIFKHTCAHTHIYMHTTKHITHEIKIITICATIYIHVCTHTHTHECDNTHTHTLIHRDTQTHTQYFQTHVCTPIYILICGRKKLTYGRAKQVVWPPSTYANVVRPESLSRSAIVKEGQYVLEQDFNEFTSEDNLHSVGPYFGFVTLSDTFIT